MIVRFWISLALTITSSLAFAIPWALKVTPNTNFGTTIEYEISRDASFESASLVDQGFSQDPNLKGDLPGGLYYLRFRSSGSKAGTPAPWSSPSELLLTNRKSTEFLEPLEGTHIESPNTKTSLLYRWKPIEGASTYALELKNIGSKKTIALKTTNPFITADLPYGTWSASLNTYVGKKLIASTTSPLKIYLEPTTQEGAHFLSPQNDDIIVAQSKTLLEFKRSYIPVASTLVIQAIGESANSPSLKLEMSSSQENFTMPPLAKGTYQITIIDELAHKNTVESNIVIRAEEDPFGLDSRGSKTNAEASLGFITGDQYQTNHYYSPKRIFPGNKTSFPRFIALVRNDYFDPYAFELRAESFQTKFDTQKTFSNSLPVDSQSALSLGASLLYRIHWPANPNNIFLRAGLFSTQYYQVSQDPSTGNFAFQNRLIQTPIRLQGITLGADWDWRTMLRLWSSRLSLRLMIPLLSQSSRIATGSVSQNPALEVSATFKRKIGEFTYFTISPEIKTEHWVISETVDTQPKSENYLVGAGVQFGFGLEL